MPQQGLRLSVIQLDPQVRELRRVQACEMPKRRTVNSLSYDGAVSMYGIDKDYEAWVQAASVRHRF